MMNRGYRRLVVVLVALAVLVALVAWLSGAFAKKERVVWDFRTDRTSGIVGWPADKQGRDWWSPPKRRFEQIKLLLPERPELVSSNPTNVYFKRKSGRITSIKISEPPVTRKEALTRLRDLARAWNWPWQESAYTEWERGADAGSTMQIGAGDRWDSKAVPAVSAGIIHAAATPDRPWYVQLQITWPEEAAAPQP